MAKARTKAARALAKKPGKKRAGKPKPSAKKKPTDEEPPVEEPPVEAEPPVEEEPEDHGPVLLRDTQAYGPLSADPAQPDQDLDRYTFGTVVKSEKAFRVCWGLWDADALLWRNMRGDAVQPNSEWLRVKDVSEGGRYQRAPAGTHTEARFTTLWRPVVEGL